MVSNFRLLEIAIGSFYFFIGSLIISIFTYPGSSHFFPESNGYDLSLNFLSDLGRTLTYTGQHNYISSVTFTFATFFIFIGLSTYFLSFQGIMIKNKVSHFFAILGSIAGLLCGAAFLGIGLTPDNLYHEWHMHFVHFGFRMFLLVMILHSVSIFYNQIDFSKISIVVYLFFGLILSFYIYLMNWGPGIDHLEGFMLNVIMQKVTVLGLAASVYIQSILLRNHQRLFQQ